MMKICGSSDTLSFVRYCLKGQTSVLRLNSSPCMKKELTTPAVSVIIKADCAEHLPETYILCTERKRDYGKQNDRDRCQEQ